MRANACHARIFDLEATIVRRENLPAIRLDVYVSRVLVMVTRAAELVLGMGTHAKTRLQCERSKTKKMRVEPLFVLKILFKEAF